MIKTRTRWWILAGAILLTLVPLGLLIRTWVVPALILAQIQAHYRGKATIRGWWWDGKSAGIVGLSLFEGEGSDSAAWATADGVSVDLTPGRLIRGQFLPRRVTIDLPRVTLRLDRDGRPLTRIPIKPEEDASKPAPAIPELVAEKARVTIRQEGRPEMVLNGVAARLVPGPSGRLRLSAAMNHPTWGHWVGEGGFSPDFKGGEVRLTGRGLAATPEKEARIPFVPAEVWKNVTARGPMEARLGIRLAPGKEPAISVRTDLDLGRATVTLPQFGIDTS